MFLVKETLKISARRRSKFGAFYIVFNTLSRCAFRRVQGFLFWEYEALRTPGCTPMKSKDWDRRSCRGYFLGRAIRNQRQAFVIAN